MYSLVTKHIFLANIAILIRLNQADKDIENLTFEHSISQLVKGISGAREYAHRRNAFLAVLPPEIDVNWNIEDLSSTFKNYSLVINHVENVNKTTKNITSGNVERLNKSTKSDNSTVSIDEHNINGTTYKVDPLAEEFFNRTRLLCWVMTHPPNHKHQAYYVKHTWGKRCDRLLFMSTVEDVLLPSIKLPVENEGRQYLWNKTKAAFKYVYEHHQDDADWFLKTEDDTYVIIENLKYMLSDYDSNEPTFFGRRLKSPFEEKQTYMDSGAGYMLSRSALHLLINFGLPSPELCDNSDQGIEDIELAKCLHRIGVQQVDTRDMYLRERFFHFMPRDNIFPDTDLPFWHNLYYILKTGLDCCSDSAVSFHRVEPHHMYIIEYLIYHLRAFGPQLRIESPKHTFVNFDIQITSI